MGIKGDLTLKYIKLELFDAKCRFKTISCIDFPLPIGRLFKSSCN
jgi:hypothetical protein